MRVLCLLPMISVFILSGCMDPTPDYSECVSIETARCEVRGECQGNETFDEEYPNFDVDTCIAYAKEHCRTRKILGDFTQVQVEDCVDAINGLATKCEALTPRGVDETLALWDCKFIDDRDAGPRPKDTSPEDAGVTDTEADSETTETPSDAGAN